MDELIKMILALPDIQLKNDLWKALSTIYNELEEPTIQSFSAYMSELSIDVHTKNKILLFMKSWFELTPLLLKWLQGHSNLFVSEMKTPLGGDDTIPLVIALIPNDLQLLHSLLEKITLATELAINGSTGYALVTMYSALQNKIDAITNKQTHTDDEMKNIVDRLHKRYHVNQLHNVSVIYKFSLAIKFITFYKLEEQENYEAVINKNIGKTLNELEILDELILENKVDPYKPGVPSYHLYLQQYLIVTDLIYSLEKNDMAKNIIKEFCLKFIYHEDVLKSSIDQSLKFFIKSTRQYFGIKTMFELFGMTTRKECFLEIATQTINNKFFFENENMTISLSKQ